MRSIIPFSLSARPFILCHFIHVWKKPGQNFFFQCKTSRSALFVSLLLVTMKFIDVVRVVEAEWVSDGLVKRNLIHFEALRWSHEVHSKERWTMPAVTLLASDIPTTAPWWHSVAKWMQTRADVRTAALDPIQHSDILYHMIVYTIEVSAEKTFKPYTQQF